MSRVNTEKSIFDSLEIIERRINEKITIESIAADIYISKFHYMRLFREIVGDSVMEYITKRRLSLAAKAIIETDISILDIALNYGYDSRDGFSRSFKAFMGVTPAQYRRHGSEIIKQKVGKEHNDMKYAETTEAIAKEISEWISQATDLAGQIRQTNRHGMDLFWNGVADQTKNLASISLTMLDKISLITQNPDEISNGIDIIKSIDDVIFAVHCIAFQIEMMEVKMPEQDADKLFTERFRSLAWSGIEKNKKISEFLRELSLLILRDMRKTVGELIQDIAEKGKIAADGIPENLMYIKDEIIQLADVLSTAPIELVTMQMLDDSCFKMKLIAITAKLNIDAADSEIFENMQNFLDALNAAAYFCGTMVKPATDPSPLLHNIKVMQDIVYMENVLFFYAIGELECLSKDLVESDNQAHKEELIKLKTAINDFRKTTFYAERDECEISVFQNVAKRTNEIVSHLCNVSNMFGMRGAALKVIADELGRLAAKTMQLINDINETVKI